MTNTTDVDRRLQLTGLFACFLGAVTMQIYVPSRVEILRKLDRLSELANNAATIAEVEDQLTDELGQLECDIANRAGIETGKIKDD